MPYPPSKKKRRGEERVSPADRASELMRRRVCYRGNTAISAGPAAPRPHGAPGQRPLSRLAPTDGRFIDGHQIDFLAELRNPYSGAIRYQPPKTLVNSSLNTWGAEKAISSATPAISISTLT